MVLSVALLATEIMIAVFTKRVWRRSRARTRGISSRSTPVARLPLEIVETVVAYLIYDRRSLLACSLVSYPWYIASVPHLYHTLYTYTFSRYENPKLRWPKPLLGASKHGLLPFVKKLQVRAFPDATFSPKRLNSSTLRHFSALTNVRELAIDFLEIPRFVPGIQQYFGHFSPTVRSLTLLAPKGTHRQIIFFIGLFQYLEDLTLSGTTNQVDNSTLVPPFIPPLRGRLTLSYHRWEVGLLKDMLGIFGGIRFRSMDLYAVEGTRLLLGACAKTLETLRLHPTDPHGK